MNVRGRVEVRRGSRRARLHTEDLSVLILVPHPAHRKLDELHKEAAGVALFAYLHGKVRTFSGHRVGDRLLAARVVEGEHAEHDIPLVPGRLDAIGQKLARHWGAGHSELVERLHHAGIHTASALYHRLRNHRAEGAVFAEYLGVELDRIERLLEAIEEDSETMQLTVAPAKKPVRRGVVVGDSADAPTTAVVKSAPDTPPEFPDDQATPDLPSKVDHSPQITGVRDQGHRNTCTAFASVAMAEQALIAAGRADRTVHLSEQYTYWATKQIDGLGTIDGSMIRFALEALRLDTKSDQEGVPGSPFDRFWEYEAEPEEGDVAQGPPPSEALQAEKSSLQASTAVQHDSISAIKRALAAGGCVGLSLYTYHFWTDAHAWLDGVISLPFGIDADGGHAICLVGYEDSDDQHRDGSFLFKNSWGVEWGTRRSDPGFGNLPYRYVLTETIEAWSASL